MGLSRQLVLSFLTVIVVTSSVYFISMSPRWSPKPYAENPREMSTLEVSMQARIASENYNKSILPSKVTISAEFLKNIPVNNAYWNRRLHQVFEQLDREDEMTSKQPSGFPCLSNSNIPKEISDFGSYPLIYKNFLSTIDCRDFPIIINQPQKCAPLQGGGHTNRTFLLLAIKSLPKHFEERQTIRETWGREQVFDGGLRAHSVFLLGSTGENDPDLQLLLNYESSHFGDLLQWGFQDNFFNLTLKDNLFLHWTSMFCPDAQFIFKGDDDVFANPQQIVSYLRSLDAEQASKLYAGQIVTQASPIRDPKSKYYVPKTFYDGPYPPYAGGGGYLFSGAFIKPLYHISQALPLYPIDDVYTGMCFQALGVTPLRHEQFQTFDIWEKDREDPCVHSKILLVHQRSPQQTKHLWNAIHSPELKC
ncbi:N-acetyllactosaminide beta-1,3-N-acetylglucosaminyltransferase 2-like [Erpetoichthys calabaricus]|uniref:Hexosyltransferase n=1 Tax=Erpetoichthys calabaricus TaxID=27687 RepID=A0A8C4TP64_ERPCA|nr:N-acetyllactosaminide beta-1,3-N-acetylglucosaminyltransferase 2-like [Erpetoichthys calabaricus]XP_051777462.1 N-acetyllactosaminide beta-1,3-N-acetylglucosaminyltransferase 2-like [Erpetoichthys calabaricus]